LALVTRTIRSILPDARHREQQEKGVGGGPHLRPRDSLIAALDLFRKTGTQTLPVCQRGRLIGTLSKRQLLQEITVALGESGS
jgi:hypothetical protein